MSTTTAPVTPTSRPRTAVVRLRVPRAAAVAYVAAGLVLTTTAIALAVRHDTGVGSVLLFAVLPDLAFLLALGQSHQPGQLARRAVPAYNLMHHPALPALLLVASATGLLGTYWLVAALAWGAHIAFDRAAGYGLRTSDGWQRA